MIHWYSLPQNQIGADLVNGNSNTNTLLKSSLNFFLGEICKQNESSGPRLSLLLNIDGKPVVKSRKHKQASVQ